MTKRYLILFLVAASVGSAVAARATPACVGSISLVLAHASTTVEGAPLAVTPKDAFARPELIPSNQHDVSPAQDATMLAVDPETGELRHLGVQRSP